MVGKQREQKINIWLDDVRPKPTIKRWDDDPGDWVLITDPREAIRLIDLGIVNAIDFDHDLQTFENGVEITGYTVAKHIEEGAANGTIKRIKWWSIHSGNPTGSMNIDRAMKSAERLWDDQEIDSKFSTD